MFNLFRKRSILADLIPEGFVDIHSHILPGIDDGAKDIEESLSLISQMERLERMEFLLLTPTDVMLVMAVAIILFLPR